MAITTIEGYTPMSTGRIALGTDGSIWRYQPNVAGGMLQLEPPGTIAPMTTQEPAAAQVTVTQVKVSAPASNVHANSVHRRSSGPLKR